MTSSRVLMDSDMMSRSIKRIAHEILERNKGANDLVLVGIKSRGEVLAKRLHDHILSIEGVDVVTLSMDFSPWRDDLISKDFVYPPSPYDFTDKIVVLCDDVLYRGRTVRAAMDGVMHYGRAKMIELAILVDRGHRQLPIKADFVGKNIPTSESEDIAVHFKEYDEIDEVIINRQEEAY